MKAKKSHKKSEKTTRKDKVRAEDEKWTKYLKGIKNMNKFNALAEKNHS